MDVLVTQSRHVCNDNENDCEFTESSSERALLVEETATIHYSVPLGTAECTGQRCFVAPLGKGVGIVVVLRNQSGQLRRWRSGQNDLGYSM